MKTIQSFLIGCLLLFSGILSAQTQWKTLEDHPLYPFSKYNGDTVAYLTRNFDGGADPLYFEQPLSKFLQAIDPSMPIKTFFPDYYVTAKHQFISIFFCFPYTKEELKRLVKEGKPIYAIGISFQSIGGRIDGSVTKEPELFKYIQGLGLGQILPWTPELQQKVGHLSFDQAIGQEVTPTVKRYLEYHP